MKQLDAVEIEFSSERIMANTCKILVIPAILLACSSLGSAIVKQNVDVSKNFKNVDYDIQFSRGKRQEDFKETDNPVKVGDKFLESQTIYNRAIIEEAIRQRAEKKDKEQDTFRTDNNAKEDAEVITKIYH